MAGCLARWRTGGLSVEKSIKAITLEHSGTNIGDPRQDPDAKLIYDVVSQTKTKKLEEM